MGEGAVSNIRWNHVSAEPKWVPCGADGWVKDLGWLTCVAGGLRRSEKERKRDEGEGGGSFPFSSRPLPFVAFLLFHGSAQLRRLMLSEANIFACCCCCRCCWSNSWNSNIYWMRPCRFYYHYYYYYYFVFYPRVILACVDSYLVSSYLESLSHVWSQSACLWPNTKRGHFSVTSLVFSPSTTRPIVSPRKLDHEERS